MKSKIMKNISLLLSVIVLFSCNQSQQNQTAKDEKASVKKIDSVLTHWIYSSDTDQMRNIINRYATLISVDEQFSIHLRLKDNEFEIFITSNKDIFTDKELLYKFDNDSIIKAYCGKSDDATALFLFSSEIDKKIFKDMAKRSIKEIEADENKFIQNKLGAFKEQLKSHKKLFIEAHLYSKTKQAIFNIEGLKWE